MKELSKEELLKIVNCVWTQGQYTPCDWPENCSLDNSGEKCNQAYQQICKLIEEKFPYPECQRCKAFVDENCAGVHNALECLHLASKMKLKPKVSKEWLSAFLREMPIYDNQARKDYAIKKLQEEGFEVEK